MQPPFKPPTPQVFTLEQIEEVTKQPSFQKDLMQAISDGFVAFHKGDFNAAPIQTLGAPPMAPFVTQEKDYASQTCVKSGYFRNNPYYVIKVASGGHPWPNSGLMQLYSQATGRCLAFLLDEGILTELRTAAVGALAAHIWAPKTIQCLGMVGTGVQARYQLRFLDATLPPSVPRRVLVYGRSPDKVAALQGELSQEGWDVVVAQEANELLSACDVIVTTTCAREAVLGKGVHLDASRRRPLLITCIGSDAPGKLELDMTLIEKADLRVADSLSQTRERGEFQAWCRQQDSIPDNEPTVYALGHILYERKDLQRRKTSDPSNLDDRLIIFDSSGVALQDCVVAQMVYEALTKERT